MSDYAKAILIYCDVQLELSLFTLPLTSRAIVRVPSTIHPAIDREFLPLL
jgi:hypothetical protein